MHNNYHFLKHLTRAIKPVWTGARILDIYTQEKNELIIHAVDENRSELFIKAHFQPSFCCLTFPDQHHRARRNSMNLFDALENSVIRNIRLFENERAFAFEFDEGYQLTFKLFGNKSNLVLFKGEDIIEVFRSELKNDFTLTRNLDRPINQEFDQFRQAGGNYKKLFPTFGIRVRQFLENREYGNKNIDEQWSLIQETLTLLEQPDFYVTESDDIHLTLLPDGSSSHFRDPVKALNYFFQHYFMTGLLQKEKSAIVRQLEKQISGAEKYLKKVYAKLDDLTSGNSYRQQADLLMAHLHDLNKGEKKVVLPDFYNPEKLVEITLNPRLSIQDNATHLYQKAKNQHLEVEQAERNIASKEAALSAARKHLELIGETDGIRELRKYLEDAGLTKVRTGRQEQKLPYRELTISGFVVRIGRSAKGNDEMLQKHSYKEDIWLHAKDVSGSHVLIKHQPGKTIPAPVIEKAASLAAYYSKRKNDSLCPVIVTPRKYVRKRKGDPAGLVVVDREEKVLLVVPEDL